MHDLALSNGDIVLGESGHALVSGSQRVLQSLTTGLKESYGVDRFHPRWGSALDSFVGSMTSRGTVPLMVESEVRRVVELWAQSQFLLFREQMERPSAVRGSFAAGEVISGIQSVDVTALLDKVTVRVRLKMLSGETVTMMQTARNG